MNQFFCSQQTEGEDLIGTADTAPIYVFIECPPPWAMDISNSRTLSEEFKRDYLQLRAAVQDNKLKVRFGFIYGNRPGKTTKLLIFRKPSGFAWGYQKQEFNLSNLEATLPILKTNLLGEFDIHPAVQDPKDIFICTHGSYDKCCARYGNIFYRQALETVEKLSLTQVRIWQCTHFGGHRFAPTAIAFPEGRFYGRLTPESLTAILTRQGDIHLLDPVYRGWSLLPHPAQIVERELLHRLGWDWFNYTVNCQILEQDEENSSYCFKIEYQSPEGITNCDRIEVMKDPNRAVALHLSCQSEAVSHVSPFIIKTWVKIE
ncbi:sucrase ferredoxin [Laspinema sp. D1]|uniref:sucrase ferredoxin n=1 Tax=Laspinema palackyanum TaxID=3231601 RepID=UPI00347559A2|nr:sucrase ferredoxin [Laspinema sp. D2b]